LEFEDGFLKVWLSKSDLHDADVGDVLYRKTCGSSYRIS